ncbi:MAG: PadR family transcriptional regulator [Actinobacteria bacterium]|nr:PadR family transcriptional regulator [Actinomycetota bacterium]
MSPVSTPKPIPLSYAILALIGEGGASAHDLLDYVRRGAPAFWSSAPSQVYAEPKRLERLGWVTARAQPGKTRSRRVYHLTDRGRAALRDWARRPAPYAAIRDQAHVRLLAGDLLEDDEIVASLAAMRPQLEAVEALLAESEQRALDLPHRTHYLLLAQSLGRHLVAAYRAWIDQVERELSTADPPHP